ncbi:thiamine phosphate synthase [Halobacillus litoralis]|uniref:Thiamine phosphate synthase n=1 Tax=Halobacillus litoralis TaxID=45668 RepID=A0A410M9B3_9BACI|nr:thiamine phosphate synthase [Halobacillus litoralis]QAS51276.1 thiamine phosphate synthase [Halobacillus litoralis]
MKLVAVTNGEMEETDLVRTILDLAEVVDLIILREKQKTVSGYLSFVRNLLESGVPKQKLCVHKHMDVAGLTGVDHLHLPENGAAVNKVRKIYPHLTVGVSVHTIDAAIQAEEEGADYVMYGHVYSTSSKKGRTPRGIGNVANLTGVLSIPVVAIGGIHPGKVKELTAIGVEGIAVMSGIFSAEDPLEAADRYKRKGLYDG